jgi:hypothetical protein
MDVPVNKMVSTPAYRLPDASEGGKHHPLLFEMLRSFVVLAETLNLSHAITHLGSTRQTVRRHIAQLETLKGGALFHVCDRQYALSDMGAACLPEALELLAQGEAWLEGHSRLLDGLQLISLEREDGRFYHQQQHPLSKLQHSSGDLLRRSLTAWAQTGGYLEAPEIQDIREYCTVFRLVNGLWIYTEVGEKSAFSQWVGWAQARSVVGMPMDPNPRGSQLNCLKRAAFTEVEQKGSARVDHIFTLISRSEESEPQPLAYERLLTAMQYPDGSTAVMAMCRPCYEIDIEGITAEQIQKMPKELLMK